MYKKITQGFTLIELAIALTIVALVIGGLAVPISKRLAEQQYSDTQASIDKAMEALIGYAILNRRLPCPDVNTLLAGDDRDGFENTAPLVGSITGCSIGVALTPTNAVNYHSDPDGVSWGDLPWQTLGLSAPDNMDAWNNRLRYAVFTPLTTQTGNAAVCNGNVGLQNVNCTTFLNGIAAPSGQIDIRCANPANAGLPGNAALGCLSTTVPAYSVATNAVFVVYSMGANRLGATNIVNLASISSLAFTTGAGGTASKFPDQAANAPELESGINQPAASALRRQFVIRARTDVTSNSGEYDDVFGVMSAPTFAARLASSGVWP